MKKISAFLFVLPLASIADETRVSDWLQKNEQIVKEYLLGLPNNMIGKRIAGVPLSDGRIELDKAVYLENKSNIGNGHYIYRFRTTYSGADYESYYMWAGPGSMAIEFPPCDGEWLVPGGYSVLSGDAYTYSRVRPTGQVVVTHCRLSDGKPIAPAGELGSDGS